jgi:hypothetical protein
LINGTRLLRSSLTNGFHFIAPTIGGQILNSGDVSAISFSVNDGVTWQNFSNISSSISLSSGMKAGASLSETPFTSAVPASSDTAVKFKFTLSDPTAFGFTQADFISGVVTLVGTTSCSAPVLKMSRLSDGALLTSTDFLDQFIAATISNGSSKKDSYKMVWTGSAGCNGIVAPIDYFDFSGATECMNYPRDVGFDSDRPFSFVVDPKDSMGADCTFGTSTIAVMTPSNAGTDRIERDPTGLTLRHSTVAASLSPYLVVPALSAAANNRLQISKWLTGGAWHLKGQFFKVNDDKKLTLSDTNSVPSGGFTYTTLGGHYTANAIGQGFDFLSSNNLSSAENTIARMQTATASGLSGKFLTVNSSSLSNSEIVKVSEHMLGSSPLLLSKNGSVYKMQAFASSSGDLNGKALMDLKFPNGTTSLSGVGKVTVLPLEWGSGGFAKMALAYNDSLYFGAVKSDASVVWSSAITVGSGGGLSTVVGGYENNGYLNLVSGKASDQMAVNSTPVPTFNEITAQWSGVPSAITMGNTESLIPFAVEPCGDKTMVYGYTDASATLVTGRSFTVGGADGVVSISSPLSSPLDSSYDRVACMQTQGDNPDIFVFSFYSSSAGTASKPPVYAAFNAGSTQCSVSSGMAFTTVSGPPSALSSSSALRGFAEQGRYTVDGAQTYWLVGVDDGTNVSIKEVGYDSCTASVLTLSSAPTTIGSFPSAAGFKNLTPMKTVGGTMDPTLWLYGTGGAVELQNQ